MQQFHAGNVEHEVNVLEAGDKLYWDGRAWQQRAAGELALLQIEDSADRDVLDPGRVA